MKAKGVEDLSFLILQAEEMGVHMHCCDTSLQLFGWCNEELRQGDATHWCGVTTFLTEAMKSRVTLFI
jgi:peroxiredoxin family protein